MKKQLLFLLLVLSASTNYLQAQETTLQPLPTISAVRLSSGNTYDNTIRNSPRNPLIYIGGPSIRRPLPVQVVREVRIVLGGIPADVGEGNRVPKNIPHMLRYPLTYRTHESSSARNQSDAAFPKLSDSYH